MTDKKEKLAVVTGGACPVKCACADKNGVFVFHRACLVKCEAKIFDLFHRDYKLAIVEHD